MAPFQSKSSGKNKYCKIHAIQYSQINYLSSFLPVPEHIVETMENLITNFVKGNLTIADKRFFLSVDDGGLGLFPVKGFRLIPSEGLPGRTKMRLD